jgi:hypothetical protein
MVSRNYYTLTEAAQVLQENPERRILEMLETGEIEGE